MSTQVIRSTRERKPTGLSAQSVADPRTVGIHETVHQLGRGLSLERRGGATITVDPERAASPLAASHRCVGPAAKRASIESTRLRHLQATAAWWGWCSDLDSGTAVRGGCRHDRGGAAQHAPRGRAECDVFAAATLVLGRRRRVTLSRARFRDDEILPARGCQGGVERVLAGGVIVENVTGVRFWQCSRPSLRRARPDRGRTCDPTRRDDCERPGGSRAVTSRANPCRRVQPAEPAGERHRLFLSVAAARRKTPTASTACISIRRCHARFGSASISRSRREQRMVRTPCRGSRRVPGWILVAAGGAAVGRTALPQTACAAITSPTSPAAALPIAVTVDESDLDRHAR